METKQNNSTPVPLVFLLRILILFALFQFVSACTEEPASPKAGDIAQILQKAEKGDASAQYRVATMYQTGEGTAVNPGKASYWYLKAAQLVLSSAYLGEADSGLRDFEKAFYWMLNSAKTGIVPAQYEVSRMYIKGIGTGVDYSQGVYWLEKAAEGGSPSAMKALGGAYYKGFFGLKHGPEKAKYWLEKSHNV